MKHAKRLDMNEVIEFELASEKDFRYETLTRHLAGESTVTQLGVFFQYVLATSTTN